MKEGFLLSLYLTDFLSVQWFIRFCGCHVHNRADIRNSFCYSRNLFNNEACNKFGALTTTGIPFRMESSINGKYAVNKSPELGQSKQSKQKVPDFVIPPSVYIMEWAIF